MTKRRYAPKQLYTASRNFFNSWLRLEGISFTDEIIFNYFAMLAVAALKCRVPYPELVEKAETRLAEIRGAGEYGGVFTKDDLLEALTVYFDESAVYAKAKMMYALVGLEYSPKTKKATPCRDAYEAERKAEAEARGEEYKREKLTPRESFLLFAKGKGQAKLKELRESDPDYYKNNRNNHYTREQDIKIWIASHPYGTRSQCMKELGVCWTTAEKYFKGSGQKDCSDVVRKYRRNNPSGTVKECMETTGLSINTVKKHWNDAGNAEEILPD